VAAADLGRVAAVGRIGYAADTMTYVAPQALELHRRPPAALLDLTSDMSLRDRMAQALADLRGGWALLRLAGVLGWLDIRLRYRGSLLGPFWLTLSTAVMVASLGFLYSTLFHMELRNYLPFLALSLVLWGYISTLVTDACTCFTQAEGIVRSIRLPLSLHAARCVVRNLLVLAHNVVVIVGVFAAFALRPHAGAMLALPGVVLWLADSVAICLLLGAVCARFRDVPQIIGSVMQIAFFVSAIMWTPEQIGGEALWLQLNPFFALMELVRGPLLDHLPAAITYASALGWSAGLLLLSGFVFTRTRGRIAFWV
jgi:lipopolysaccharide transport system permease protein